MWGWLGAVPNLLRIFLCVSVCAYANACASLDAPGAEARSARTAGVRALVQDCGSPRDVMRRHPSVFFQIDCRSFRISRALRRDRQGLRAPCALSRDAGNLRGAMDGLPGKYSKLFEGRLKFAGGCSESVQELFVFLVRRHRGCGAIGRVSWHAARSARKLGARWVQWGDVCRSFLNCFKAV